LIKDLNIRSDVFKLVEEKERKAFDNVGRINAYLNKNLIAQEIRARTDK
jgi:hypothetical protein